jgi:predicted metal-dependent HD superfamily phosphohydrolase
MDPFKSFSVILLRYIPENRFIQLMNFWKENHRHYHSINHLIQILRDIETNSFFKELNVYEKHALVLASFFHDAIYDPKAKDNEDMSIKFFLSSFKLNDLKMKNKVCDLINVTKYRKRPINKLERIFWDADNAGFKKGYDTLLKNEEQIKKEYSFLSSKEYKENREKFLKDNIGLFGDSVDKDIKKLIEYIKNNY